MDEMRYELIFDDITDEFGNPLKFYVLDYTFDLVQEVNHRADEPVINHPDAHKCILRIVLQYPTNYAMQEWMVSYISEAATRKSGTFTAYNEDGSILSDVRFESAECMQLDQKGELEEGRRELTKTMTVRFSTKTLAINGITVFGELEADRRAGVTPTVREVAEEPNFIGQYLEDLEGNKTPQGEIEIGDEFYLVIETEHATGRTMSVNLKDSGKDYEYNGVHMKDDIISNIPITGNITKVKLKAVPQK